jgi:hypothetical protein
MQLVSEALSKGVKQQGREADHSLPSNAEVKKDGALPPLPHMSSWYSAYLFSHRDYFTFTFTFRPETNKHLDLIGRKGPGLIFKVLIRNVVTFIFHTYKLI